MTDQKIINRDTRGDEYKSKHGNTENEVAELLRAEATDYQAWQRLTKKYGDDQKMINEIHEAYKDSLSRIYKKAKKFKNVMFTKYGGINLSNAEYFRYAKKYQKKYKFTDDEFNMFMVLSVTDNKSSVFSTPFPTTKMAKTLGYDSLVPSNSRLNVKPEDQSIVEEIVNKYSETKPLHSQVILQSLTYQAFAPEALTGQFIPDKHNPYSYVHPVLAALFIPRIKQFDEQMLMANIGYIVKQKATEQPIVTKPDSELFWSILTDPNDIACSLNNAIVDLKNRFLLQTHIWDAVLNLRQGKYYYTTNNSTLVGFMQALENCRNVIHDAPDLTYVRDEGTILRRILSTFSLYPTYVSINRLHGLLIGSQTGYPSSPFDASGFGTITRIPMVTLRLPLHMNKNVNPIGLVSALSQPQWVVENKTIVPKALQLIHSGEVLIFYVGRRYQTLNIARMSFPYNFNNLPMTVTGWEALNEYPVDAPRSMTIVNDQYHLRSVVLVETAPTHKSGVIGSGTDAPNAVIVGTSAMIIVPADFNTGRMTESCFMYDPQGAGIMSQAQSRYSRNGPIMEIPSSATFVGNANNVVEPFDQRATSRGSIFVYQKVHQGGLNPFFAN